jgi:hypothetical protein
MIKKITGFLKGLFESFIRARMAVELTNRGEYKKAQKLFNDAKY